MVEDLGQETLVIVERESIIKTALICLKRIIGLCRVPVEKDGDFERVGRVNQWFPTRSCRWHKVRVD